MTFRCTFLYTLPGDQAEGWSMSLYQSGTMIDAALIQAEILRQWLMTCAGGGTYIREIRVNDVDNPRSSQQSTFAGSNPAAGNSTTDANIGQACLLIKLNAAPSYVASMWLRGIPLNVIGGGSKYTPTALFSSAVKGVINQLTGVGNGWCLRNIIRNVPHTLITAATSAGVITAPGHGLTGQNKIRISKTTGISNLNGTWMCNVVDANNVQLILKAGSPLIGTFEGGGTLWEQGFTYSQITSGFPDRVSKRDVGRPSNLASGRRRRR